MMTRALADIRPVPRRGLSRDEAAMYVGVGTSKFDEMVADGRMPPPKRIDSRRVWDIEKFGSRLRPATRREYACEGEFMGGRVMMTKLRLKYVHEYRDRHGNVRRYFRRAGSPTVALPGLPGSPEFNRAYEVALTKIPSSPPSRGRVVAGSLAEVVAGYLQSAAFSNLSPSSQVTYRKALSPILEAHGHRLVREMPKGAARRMIEGIGVDRPGMANVTKSVLSEVMRYAIAADIRSDDPFASLPRYRLGSHHTWTEAEIAQFERRWKLGTRERLAFALLLYTGQRGGDVCRMARNDIVDGHIRVSQDKVRKGTTNELMIPIHPELAKALKAGPVVGMRHLITDVNGRPFRHLSKLIEAAVRRADLPHRCVAHGLRKAALRRLAEAGTTTHEIAAVSGHRSLAEIERYTRAASQERMARAAIAKMPGGDEK